MKKVLILMVVICFTCASLGAVEKGKKESAKASAPQNTSNIPTPQNTPGTPMPGMMAPGMMAAQNAVPLLRESTEALKELIKIIEGSNMAGQNQKLIQRAGDIVKRSEDIFKTLDRGINMQPQSQSQTTQGAAQGVQNIVK